MKKAHLNAIIVLIVAIFATPASYLILSRYGAAANEKSAFLYWGLIFTAILGGTCFVSGVVSGLYESFTAILGPSHARLFSSKDDKEKCIEVISSAGILGVIGGILALSVDKDGVAGLIYGIIGTVLGGTAGAISGFKRLDIFCKLKFVAVWLWQRAYSQRVIVQNISVLAGLGSFLVAQLMIPQLGLIERILAGLIGGLVSALLVILSCGLIEELQREGSFQRDPGSWLMLGGMYIFGGSITGGPLVEILGASFFTQLFMFALLVGGPFPLILSAQKTLTKGVLSITIPRLSVRRFHTILCQRCLRYTSPIKSRYAIGKRYCEHCQQEVEFTAIQGKVLFAFGKFPLKVDGVVYELTKPKVELIKLPNRQFILANPAFYEAERIVDVSEVYIDVKTCNRQRIEQFMTYVLNYPPSFKVQSITIFYRGELQELGENVKNALQNTFTQVEPFHSEEKQVDT